MTDRDGGGCEPWRGLPSAFVGEAVADEPLSGGAVNDVRRLTLADGTRVVLKSSEQAPPDLYAQEAEGLRVLREQGGLRTPRVIEVSARHLLLEALEPAPADGDAFWAEAGRAVARLHAVRGDRFGWHAEGWLGLLPQTNAWTDDGHAFFAEHRVLRYLREPKVRAALDPADLAGLERICDRLPRLVPGGPAVLNHGDLYQGNVVAASDGAPAFIDPAVCWMWAESELSMMYCTGRPPESFFAAYHEVLPLSDGWQERMPLLHLRELISTIAHFGAWGDCVPQVRDVIRRFG